MAAIKCKICGGQATLDSNNGIVVCDYCGTKQALPLFTADSERLLYDRGNNYLNHSEYDKAENVFNQLLTIKPGAAELYWDLVLCKYGVTYVKDPKTGKYIPTCNRTHYTPIFSDENYKKAIELSSGEKKALFEEDAKTIDNIQKGIIAVSKKEKPFDIFISYKETDANGNRTKDSIEAQKLYEKLTEAGYKVFFSRITLEDKVGTEYEPYIYAALYSSKVMLTICSSKENINAVWVKNEWARFLGFRQNDNSKTLLPLYFDMDKADLPEEFALLSAYDMSADGFTDELLRGIKKLIPLPIMKAKRRKQISKTIGIIATIVCAVAIAVTAIFLPGYLEDKKYQAAYLYAQELFENAKYEDAAKEFEKLSDYKDSKEMVEKCSVQPKYDAAMQLYYDGNYAEATWAFDVLGDYEDATEQKEKSALSWRRATAVLAVMDGYSVYQKNDCYYINNNGAVSPMSEGIAHKNISLQEHGKVASLGMGGDLAVVHEDGYVSNIELQKPLSDVIKISGEISYSHWVALHSDGTMSVARAVRDDDYANETQDNWESVISKFTDIVDFEFYYEGFYQGTQNEMIIAIKSDGTLCGYIDNVEFISNSVSQTITGEDIGFNNTLSKFSNVKCLKAVAPGEENSEFSIVALTKDGKLQTYINGTFSEREASEIVDVVSINKLLTSAGKIVAIDGHRVYEQDVIFAENITGSLDYYVTRSGLINGETKQKTTVQSEWISRLD